MIVSLCHALCLATHVAAAQNAAARLLLWTGSDRSWGPGLARAVHAEIAHLVVPGFSGIDLDTDAEPPESTSAFVVSVRLTGYCDTYSGRFPSKPEVLGFVLLTDGTITPSMSVRCDAILSAIKPLLRDMPLVRQNVLFARAIVRVIQHELRHILEQTAGHLGSGVFQACLKPSDLVVPSLISR